jgi:hypothetical protein
LGKTPNDVEINHTPVAVQTPQFQTFSSVNNSINRMIVVSDPQAASNSIGFLQSLKMIFIREPESPICHSANGNRHVLFAFIRLPLTAGLNQNGNRHKSARQQASISHKLVVVGKY